ncbi:hypothetical protein ACFX14_004822 [Malus domestica]
MQASVCLQTSPSSLSRLRPTHNPLLGNSLPSRPCLAMKKRATLSTKALLSATKESVLRDFHERRALKILNLTKETKRILPSVTLSVTVPPTLSLPDQATPTLAAAYSISQAVKIPVMCSSGLSAVTAPMEIAAGAAGVRSSDSLGASSGRLPKAEEKALKL